MPADGLSTCIASDNLWSHPGAVQWFSQAATATSLAGAVSIGLVPTYYHRPIGLQIASADPDGTTIYAVDNALSASFLMAVGLTERVQLTLAAPVVLYQRGASKADVVGSTQPLPRSAAGDLRFGVGLGLLPRRPARQDGPQLAARFEMAAPTAPPAAFSGHASATYAPGVSFDYRLGGLTLGADVGGRIREYSELAGAAIGTQVSLSLGASYALLDARRLSLGLETWALFGIMEQTDLAAGADASAPAAERSAAPHIPAEWMLSLSSGALLDKQLFASLGAGSFIPTQESLAVTTPAFRVALAFRYTYDGEEAPQPALP